MGGRPTNSGLLGFQQRDALFAEGGIDLGAFVAMVEPSPRHAIEGFCSGGHQRQLAIRLP